MYAQSLILLWGFYLIHLTVKMYWTFKPEAAAMPLIQYDPMSLISLLRRYSLTFTISSCSKTQISQIIAHNGRCFYEQNTQGQKGSHKLFCNPPHVKGFKFLIVFLIKQVVLNKCCRGNFFHLKFINNNGYKNTKDINVWYYHSIIFNIQVCSSQSKPVWWIF